LGNCGVSTIEEQDGAEFRLHQQDVNDPIAKAVASGKRRVASDMRDYGFLIPDFGFSQSKIQNRKSKMTRRTNGQMNR
jgi:hypothetical protein